MEKRTVEISIEQAKEWYNSNNEALKEVALSAYKEEELKEPHWKSITNFSTAFKYLAENNICLDLIKEYNSCIINSYSQKVCAYRIIVAALTNNEKVSLTEGTRYFPIVQFCEPGKEDYCFGKIEIGLIKFNNKSYKVFGGRTMADGWAGLGYFYSGYSFSNVWTSVGFCSVSSKEIAEHISIYFGKLLFEILYGGVNCDWDWNWECIN